jgi:hypothetical protein
MVPLTGEQPPVGVRRPNVGSPADVAQEELDRRVDGGRGDEVLGVGDDGELASGEVAVGDDGFLVGVVMAR